MRKEISVGAGGAPRTPGPPGRSGRGAPRRPEPGGAAQSSHMSMPSPSRAAAPKNGTSAS